MKFLKKIYRFTRYNKHKKLTLKIYFYTALYRFMILTMKGEKLEKTIGKRGEESPEEASTEDMQKAYFIGKNVCRIADKTPWQSKCLVRSMTCRKLLNEMNVKTTLYLGVGKEEGKMVAHSWLRCGKLYVTGGNGEGYATVAKFLCE